MCKMIDRYVDKFVTAIDLEMAALKEQQGAFEMMVFDGRCVDKKDNCSHEYYYSFKSKSFSEKATLNTECDLKCDGYDFMVQICEVNKKKIVLKSDMRWPGKTGPLDLLQKFTRKFF